MRPLFLALLALPIAGSSVAQRPLGTYRPVTGPPASWTINEHHTLIWDGSPYMPVGLRLDGSVASINQAVEQGIKDVLLELPASGAGWVETFAAAEAAGVRYLVSLNSLAPMAVGVSVEPQTYRIGGITKETTFKMPLPGAESALVVLATRRDGAIESAIRVEVEGGVLNYTAKPKNSLEHILLLYPVMPSLEQPDFWEGLDRHRDLLLRNLSQRKPGRGLRGIVNPLGIVQRFQRKDPQFVPTGAYFRNELRLNLEAKYKSVETAQRAWSMRSSGLSQWSEMARLIPLWSGTRGVGYLWDPQTDRTYQVNQRTSQIWNDIQETVVQAATRRYARLVAAVRSVVDVPVIQDWSGWNGPYAIAERSVDGVCMKVSGTSPLAITDAASRVSSTALRMKGPSWLVASDIDLGPTANPDTDLGNVVEDLSALGARAWYVDPKSMKPSKAVSVEAARRSSDNSLAQVSPQALFFPENAMNPAMPQRLPGGVWWLPSPLDGNRLDLGSNFFGYRYRDGSESYTAIWAKAPGRVKLRMANAKDALFMAIDGTEVKPRLVKGGVEVTLTEYPVLVSGTEEIPIPEPALNETVVLFDELLKVAEQLLKDTSEDRFLFRDTLTGFDQNPGGAFPILRQHYLRLNGRLGTFTWIEAESSREHTFSESQSWTGASGNSVLALRSQLPIEGQGYFADFVVPVRTEEEQHVWLAARIPYEKRGDVTLVVGGQVMNIQGEPVSFYSSGFAWYRMGTTRLKGPSQKVRLQVAGSGADVAADAILFSPDVFVPSGVRQPEVAGAGS